MEMKWSRFFFRCISWVFSSNDIRYYEMSGLSLVLWSRFCCCCRCCIDYYHLKIQNKRILFRKIKIRYWMFSSNVKVRQTHIEMIMMFKYDDHHMCYDEYTEWMSESVQQQQESKRAKREIPFCCCCWCYRFRFLQF